MIYCVKTIGEVNRLVDRGGVVLLKVSTESCGPCSLLKRFVEELDSEYENLTIISVDAEECDDDVISEFSVRNVPTVLVFENGSLVGRHVGLQTKEQLKGMLKL